MDNELFPPGSLLNSGLVAYRQKLELNQVIFLGSYRLRVMAIVSREEFEKEVAALRAELKAEDLPHYRKSARMEGHRAVVETDNSGMSDAQVIEEFPYFYRMEAI